MKRKTEKQRNRETEKQRKHSKVGEISVQQTKYLANIESKSLNNTYLHIIEIFNKLFKKINIIESQNLVVTLTSERVILSVLENLCQ